ncbi:hypothetical protein [Staphylococcus pseudintermedius]|uniref:hypothetical protein n=1 Tax=Staphylococcus pseudintermedius TaxID=283734 RepID=UPI003F756A22
MMDAMRYALLTFVETFEQRSVEDEIDLIQQLGIFVNIKYTVPPFFLFFQFA